MYIPLIPPTASSFLSRNVFTILIVIIICVIAVNKQIRHRVLAFIADLDRIMHPDLIREEEAVRVKQLKDMKIASLQSDVATLDGLLSGVWSNSSLYYLYEDIFIDVESILWFINHLTLQIGQESDGDDDDEDEEEEGDESDDWNKKWK